MMIRGQERGPRYTVHSSPPNDRSVQQGGIEFETDAVNDYFKRTDSQGSIVIDPPNIIEHSHLWNGRFTAQLRTPWHAKPGDSIAVKFSVSDVDTQKKGGAYRSQLTILARPEADPRRGGGKAGRRKHGNR